MIRKIYLYIIVLISGASVLAVEILGTRILGPFYGVSLFLWSALITITLIALSIGYTLGGYWADRRPSMGLMCSIIITAGVWLLLLPLIKKPILMVTEPLGLRPAVLVTAFILFSPPLTLLGMVSPFAIRIKASRLDEVGRTAGNLYAISTVGSVAAALLTGFVLIPNMGVTHLILAIGLTLVISAGVGIGIDWKFHSRSIITMVLIMVFAIVSIWIVPPEKADPEAGLLAFVQSAYAELRVLDVNNSRHLLIDGSLHTQLDVTSGESVVAYSSVFELFKYFHPDPGNLLLIGIGGGAVVKNYARAGWEIDAVEIDPKVTDLAIHFFGLTPEDGNYFAMDGRQFLITNDRLYDVIIMDAFGSSYIPFHLVTVESFKLIKDHLKPGGMLGMNVISIRWEDHIVKSLGATLKEHFNQVWVLPTGDPPGNVNNVLIFAADQPFEFQVPYPDSTQSHLVTRHINQAWGYRFEPDMENALVLTDEFNPVDLWAEEINHAVRKREHQFYQQSDAENW